MISTDEILERYSHYEVNGYPTIILEAEGQNFTKYEGERNVEAILHFLRNGTSDS